MLTGGGNNLGQRRHSESKGHKPDFCATAEPCLTLSYTEKANGPNRCIPREFSDPSFFFNFFLIFLNRSGKQVLITTTSYLSLILNLEKEEVAVQRS